MAKRDESKSTDKTSTVTPEVVAPTEAVTPAPAAPEAPTESALATVDPNSLAELIPVLPHLKRDLLRTTKVRPEEFAAALMALPENLRDNFQDLMERMNPDRESRAMGDGRFRPMTVKLYQGVGEKPKNPKLPKGGVEDGSGNILLVPEAFKDDFEGIPQRLLVSVIFMNIGRSYWPGRGPDGQPQIPPGLDIKGNQLICGSRDRIRGSRFGECKNCPHLPSFEKKDKTCKDNIDLYVVKPDLTGIYQITVNASGFKTCTGVIEAKAGSWKHDYDGQFYLESLSVEKPGQNYVTWKASPVTSKTEPNGVINTPEVQNLMKLLMRQIKTEVYYPQLAVSYARSLPTASVPGSLADLEAAAKGTDYSGTNNIPG